MKFSSKASALIKGPFDSVAFHWGDGGSESPLFSPERRTGSHPADFGDTPAREQEDEPWGAPVAQTHRRTKSHIVKTIKGRQRARRQTVGWEAVKRSGGGALISRWRAAISLALCSSACSPQLLPIHFPFLSFFFITALLKGPDLLKHSGRVGCRGFTRIAHKTGEQKGQRVITQLSTD